MEINNITIFHGLSKEAVSFIFNESQETSFLKDEIVFEEGDRSGELFLLKSGKVGIYKNKGPDNIFMGELDAGSCFGEMELIDLGPRTASVKAFEDIKVVIANKKTLHQLFKLFPQDYLILIHNIAREISRRLRLIDDLLVKIELKLKDQGFSLKIKNNEPIIKLKD